MTERDRERGESPEPLDEEAAWAAIVAGYGERPTPGPAVPEDDQERGGAHPEREAVVPGVWHPDAVPDRADRSAPEEPAVGDGAGSDTPGSEADEGKAADAEDPERAVRAEGVNSTGQWSGPGPRDWAPEDDDDEGHFVPPEPPPLPETDLITRFAWLGVVGGPVLLVVCAIFGIDVTWWIACLGIGGFLGGFATLVLGMRDEHDDEWTDPGSGAVV